MDAFDVVVIGGGAAGLMCAASAGRRGRRVLVLERGEKVGAKILISGGGRCNFTNREVRPERFLGANPHFHKSALSRYTPDDFIALVERYRIAYHEKTLGQLFCDGSARQIVAMLLDECASAGVEVRCNQRVTDVSKSERFRVTLEGGDHVTAAAVVLASGGLSIPKMGASNFAHMVAKRFGLAVTEMRPALVPLTLGDDELALARPLSGVSCEAIATRERQNGRGSMSFRESLLFTHRGLSGPSILQISSYWRPGDAITIDLLPDLDASAFFKERKRSRPKAELKTILGEVLPNRLAQSLVGGELRDPFPDAIMASLSDKVLDGLAARLKSWRFVPSGTEGYPKAEVTLGGIDTNGLSSQTMESRKVPGLYAIGEAVDVTGWLGGYNFQWAWSSGWCAGQAV